MVNKSVIFNHVATHYPLIDLGKLGVDLGSVSLDRDTELHRLGTVISGLNSDGELLSWGYTALEATEGNLASAEVLPFTLGCVYRAIVYRRLPENAAVNPKITKAWEKEDDRESLISNEKISAYGSSILLKVFLNGLKEGGVPLQTSKSIIRDQIEEVLRTECDGVETYTAINATRYFYQLMKYAKLHTPKSRLAQIRRTALILKYCRPEPTNF